LGNSDDIHGEFPVHDNDYILFLVDSKRIFSSNKTTVKHIVIPSMSNTKNILLLTVIMSLLVIGTTVLPTQTNVQAQKEPKDRNQSIKEDTNAQSANQKASQDNVCVRGEDCEQGNQDQQIACKDNEADGFNDQSANVQSPGAQPTPSVTPPTTGTLNVCKTVVDNTGSGPLPSASASAFTSEGADPAEFTGRADCTTVTLPAGQYNFGESIGTDPSSSILTVSVSGDCARDSFRTFQGSINAGETQTCRVTNTFDKIIG
jgi:hypothetical protein